MRDPPRSGSKLTSPALDSLPLHHQESPRIFFFFFFFKSIEGFSERGSHGWYCELEYTDFRAAGREQI